MGLSWTNSSRLCNVDFAGNTALLNSSWNGMKELTKRLEDDDDDDGGRGLSNSGTNYKHKFKKKTYGCWEM